MDSTWEFQLPVLTALTKLTNLEVSCRKLLGHDHLFGLRALRVLSIWDLCIVEASWVPELFLRLCDLEVVALKTGRDGGDWRIWHELAERVLSELQGAYGKTWKMGCTAAALRGFEHWDCKLEVETAQ